MDKIFTSCEDQIKILKTRGLKIVDERKALSVLEREGYYNLVNGYKELFVIDNRTNREHFIAGTTFDELYSLYTFDRKLRFVMLQYLLKIENTFKTVVSYNFAKEHGVKDYLKASNFNKHESKVKQFIKHIEHTVATQLSNKNSMIVHYNTYHGYIPMWVLSNILTLGEINKFYSYLQDSDKSKIAVHLSNIFHTRLYPDDLSKYIGNIGLVRNKCAHDQRLYDFRTRYSISTNNAIYKALGITRNINSLFDVTICMSQLMDADEFSTFMMNIKRLSDQLKSEIKTIPFGTITKKIGLDDTNILKILSARISQI